MTDVTEQRGDGDMAEARAFVERAINASQEHRRHLESLTDNMHDAFLLYERTIKTLTETMSELRAEVVGIQIEHAKLMAQRDETIRANSARGR